MYKKKLKLILYANVVRKYAYIPIYIVLYTILGEYVKNLCLTSDKSCIPCPGRLPSCRGLSDGLHSFPGRLWMEDYIKCFRNRTMDVSKCTTGYFNPTLRACTTKLGRSKYKL